MFSRTTWAQPKTRPSRVSRAPNCSGLKWWNDWTTAMIAYAGLNCTSVRIGRETVWDTRLVISALPDVEDAVQLAIEGDQPVQPGANRMVAALKSLAELRVQFLGPLAQRGGDQRLHTRPVAPDHRGVEVPTGVGTGVSCVAVQVLLADRPARDGGLPVVLCGEEQHVLARGQPGVPTGHPDLTE